MSDVLWIPWAVALARVRQLKNCDAERTGAILFDELRIGRLGGAGETSLECPAENKAFPEPAPDWQPQFIEQGLWRLGKWLPSVPALKLPDRVISNLHVDDVGLATLVDALAPTAIAAAAKASSKKPAAPRSEHKSLARAPKYKFNKKWKYQPKALRERMKPLASLWDTLRPTGRQSMVVHSNWNNDPALKPDGQSMFDFLDCQADFEKDIAELKADRTLTVSDRMTKVAEVRQKLARVAADIFELVNKADDHEIVLSDAPRFLEIAEEVARLNPPLTAARAMECLIKSFEEGEFERDGKSGVYQCGKRWSREFHEKAKAIPEAQRGNTSDANTYRISKAMLTDWGLRWGFRLAPGFTTLTATKSPPSPKLRRGGSEQIDDTDILNELHLEASTAGFTLRDAILKRETSIKGKNAEAKVRRLTRKYSERFRAI